jgi:lipopolysaccharide/colanic/teichoic acid biosynthesis glycosyltransferase
MTTRDAKSRPSGRSLGVHRDWPRVLDCGLRRALDIVCAGAAAFVLVPIVSTVALAILIESGTPILFSQLRLGQNGRPFLMYKFRKFKPDCDDRGCPLTVGEDGRLTAVGRMLGATKLDELPQLWNVLRGDMSLVGPRPESRGGAECFRGGVGWLHDHKPGLFGPCQVLFRDESALYPADGSVVEFYRDVLFPAKAEIDLAYFSRRTLISDLGWILRGTWMIVVGSRVELRLCGQSIEIGKMRRAPWR